MIYLFLALTAFSFADKYQTTLVGNDKLFVYTTNNPKPIPIYEGPLLEVPFSLICYRASDSMGKVDSFAERVCVYVNKSNCQIVETILNKKIENGASRELATQTMFLNKQHREQTEHGELFEYRAEEKGGKKILSRIPEAYMPHIIKAGEIFRERGTAVSANATIVVLASLARYHDLPSQKQDYEVSTVRPEFFEACKSYGIDLEKAYYRAPAEIKKDTTKIDATQKETEKKIPQKTNP